MDKLEKRFNKARELLGIHIQDTCSAILSAKLPDIATLQDLLGLILLDTLSETFPPEKHVNSLEEFVLVTRTIFSDSYRSHFLRRAKEFDRLSGVDTLSDVFLSTQPIDVWIKTIVCALASDAEEAANVELGFVDPLQANCTASSLNELTPPSSCPVQDIVLSGRTIRDAWFAHEETRLMEEDACSHILRNGSWDPSQTHRMPVYHGTPGPLCGTGRLEVDWDLAYKLCDFFTVDEVLEGSVSMNQVAPKIKSLPVLWTSFSPLRSFLWATFEAEVLRDVPPMRASQYMVKEWHCLRGPHVHRGIRLLKFRPSLTGSPQCTTYVMPNGLQDNWYAATLDASTQLILAAAPHSSPDDAWRYLRFLHGQETASWPNVLHCHELGSQETMLRHFTKQLWRTAWLGTGIDALNAARESIMSISLTITASDGTGSSKDKGNCTPCP